MDDLIRLLVLLGLAGLGLTVVGAVAVWHANEGRRIRRGLKAILGGELHGYLVALGRGRGVGFNFSRNQLAVAWDQGAWGLIYKLEELRGAEAIADGMVVGRVFRGETRRALDNLGGAEERVTLRLVLDDLTHPEFLLDLWLISDEGRRHAWTSADALEEANRWLARLETLFRRPAASAATPAPAAVQAPAPAVAKPSPAPEDDAPPWDEDDAEDIDEDAESLPR